MTASALLQGLNEKKQSGSYHKSMSAMKSSLLSGQKDSLPAKSRNPAAQVSLSQKQGAMLQTLPNALGSSITAADLGISGGSAMTLMFNQQTARKTTHSKDAI